MLSKEYCRFWPKLHWTSRAFTISSVVAGLACSAGGPVNEYIAELRHRDDQRRLQQSVERLRSETTLQSSWKKAAIDGTVLPEVLLENQNHEDARGTPAVVAAHAQNRASHKYSAAHPESVQAMDRTVYEDVPDLLTSRTSLYTCLLLLSSGFWLYVAFLPYLQASIFETDEHTCHGISAVFKRGFVLLLLCSVAFEYWLIAQTQKGLKYLKHHRLQVAFHVSLTCLGKVRRLLGRCLLGHGERLWLFTVLQRAARSDYRHRISTVFTRNDVFVLATELGLRFQIQRLQHAFSCDRQRLLSRSTR